MSSEESWDMLRGALRLQAGRSRGTVKRHSNSRGFEWSPPILSRLFIVLKSVQKHPSSSAADGSVRTSGDLTEERGGDDGQVQP